MSCSNRHDAVLVEQMNQLFTDTITKYKDSAGVIPALAGDVFRHHEEDSAAVSDFGSCQNTAKAPVNVSAPEVFMAARYLNAMEQQLEQKGVDMRLRLLDAFLANLGQEQSAHRPAKTCPYSVKQDCVIHPVRPLECRNQSAENAGGAAPEVMSAIQNALQTALAEAEYPADLYDLNHALTIVMHNDDAEIAWLANKDPLAAAALSV
ncbi:MAG: hypothetical protein CMI08_10865 [Oceanospirillaceae bacterium]|uniref:hypothetical protein n=1 Tax=unclassified Thalassolituus TaxID=2624967 RepID=UPI000C65C79D|nr:MULTISPECIES: hypothetical protein [unclassified Thalassolituus]MAS24158.1 hypothetical protein [Oceanospirillaceae bacterium]MAX99681.1 hypothetical protein [Oceanospirillaceae bacterium]MBL35430.1 hypothetical protein [Oceanospirillaceae bacterium]MBS51887.1 hypothetical protein [Oceanospirillaceae bacterium]